MLVCRLSKGWCNRFGNSTSLTFSESTSIISANGAYSKTVSSSKHTNIHSSSTIHYCSISTVAYWHSSVWCRRTADTECSHSMSWMAASIHKTSNIGWPLRPTEGHLLSALPVKMASDWHPVGSCVKKINTSTCWRKSTAYRGMAQVSSISVWNCSTDASYTTHGCSLGFRSQVAPTHQCSAIYIAVTTFCWLCCPCASVNSASTC